MWPNECYSRSKCTSDYCFRAHMSSQLLCCLWKNSMCMCVLWLGIFECTHPLFSNWALVWRDQTHWDSKMFVLINDQFSTFVQIYICRGCVWLKGCRLRLTSEFSGVGCTQNCSRDALSVTNVQCNSICTALTVLWLMCARVVCLYIFKILIYTADYYSAHTHLAELNLLMIVWN